MIFSSHVRFSGFKVTNAQGEGILAAGLGHVISGISISHSAIVHNDLGGGVPPKSMYFECAAQGQVPGDCGEGVHLTGVAHSTVKNDFIAGFRADIRHVQHGHIHGDAADHRRRLAMDQGAAGIRKLAVVSIVVADGQHDQFHGPARAIRESIADVITGIYFFDLDDACFPREYGRQRQASSAFARSQLRFP